MASSLENKLRALVQISEKKLTEILDRIVGPKDFIIESQLMKPLQRITGVRKLRASGVDKIYEFDSSKINITNSQRVFFISANLISAKCVCDAINGERNRTTGDNSYHVIIVGRKLKSIETLFEQEGLHSTATLYQFPWELISLDDKVFSLELNTFYKNVFVEGDLTLLPVAARSIWSLQMLLGQPSATIVQGKNSRLVHAMVDRLNEELGRPEQRVGDVSCFIIVDRDLDHPSCLLTGCTYVGLLDEVLNIKSGVVEVQPSKEGQPFKLTLNSADEIYFQTKSRHFSDVYSFLNTKVKEMSQFRERTQQASLQEMKQLVRHDLSAMQNMKKRLACHISACEAIVNKLGHKFEALQNAELNIITGQNKKEIRSYLEDCLASMNDFNKYSILRLMSLLSIFQDGLSSDELHKLKSQFLHAFGYQDLRVFHNLEKRGLCRQQTGVLNADFKGIQLPKMLALTGGRSAFTEFGHKLKLFPNASTDDDVRNPKDPSYVFNHTYVPVVCQMVHMLARQEVSPSELAKLIPNCSEFVKRSERNFTSFLVYFVGGFTYSEISAFNLIEKLTGVRVIVTGTNVINGESLMKAYF